MDKRVELEILEILKNNGVIIGEGIDVSLKLELIEELKKNKLLKYYNENYESFLKDVENVAIDYSFEYAEVPKVFEFKEFQDINQKEKKEMLVKLLKQEFALFDTDEIDLCNLDFGSEKYNIDFSRIKINGDIKESQHENSGDIHTGGNENDGDIYFLKNRNGGVIKHASVLYYDEMDAPN